MPVPPITARNTSVTAFIGVANTGDANSPTHCFSFADYERKFGGLADGSHLGYAVQQFFTNGGAEAVVVRVQDSENSDAHGIINAMRALVSEADVNLLCLPGVADPVVLSAADAYCRPHHVFLIADTPESVDTAEKMMALIERDELPPSDHTAIYFPWITVADPRNGGRPRRVPPSGSLAGVYAKTDNTRGVWRAPAGADVPLVGVLGPAFVLTAGEAAALNPRAVNCIRAFPRYGTVAWGARTLAGDDRRASEWKYVPVRRTALLIEQSVSLGLTWAAFEPNGEALWAQIRTTVGAFMHALFRQGAFQGTTPREAYFVKCDRDTTTQSDVNQGVVNVVIGFAPLRPAEFVIIKLQQLAARIDPPP